MKNLLLLLVFVSSQCLAGYSGGGITANSCAGGSFATAIANNGALTCTAASGAGTVVGPGSSTDNGFARWDSVSGALLQDTGTGATLDDSGNAVFASVTPSDLTASLPVITNGSKKLTSVSYATFLTSLGAAPATSPTIGTSMTLSYATASVPLVTDGSKNVVSVSYATFLASLGATSYTANQYGVVLSGSANVMAVLAPDASTVKTLISGGASANPAWGVLALGGGGTGATTKAGAFDALSPMTTSGDVIYGGASGTGTRLAKGSNGDVLTLASGVPSWAAPSSGGTKNYVFAKNEDGGTEWLNGTGSFKTMILETEITDVGGNYNTTTGEFTNDASGHASVYTICTSWSTSSSLASNSTTTTAIFINGTQLIALASMQFQAPTWGGTQHGCAEIALANSDVMTIRVTSPTTGTGYTGKQNWMTVREN